jgi:hypothetical protein
MMDGTTATPARDAAMTKGDWAAVPVEESRFSSLLGTIRPTMKMDKT